MPKYRVISGTEYHVEAATLAHAEFNWTMHCQEVGHSPFKKIGVITEITKIEDDYDIEEAVDEFNRSLEND